MKKLSKITAVLIAAMMLLLSFNVSAAVIEEVPSEILLSEDFAGLSELPENWSVNKQGKAGDVYTDASFNSLGLTTNQKNNLWVGCNTAFDAGNTDYTANFSFSKMASGSMVMVVGGSEDWYSAMTGYAVQSQSSSVLTAPSAGYTIQLQHVSASDNITVYKNGTSIITAQINGDLKTSTGTSSGSVGGLSNYDVSLKVTSTKVVLTVVGSATATYTGMFEYADTDPIYSGYAGIYFASTTPSTDGSTGTMKNVSIVTDASTKTTTDYYFSKQFGASDTAGAIENLGFVIDTASGMYPIAPTANGLQLLDAGYGKSSLVLDDYTFNGTYNVKAAANFSYNNMGIYLNYQDEDNYYRLDYGKAKKTDSTIVYGYILKKCVDGTLTDIAFKDYGEENKYIFWQEDTPAEITVTNEAAKTTIKVTAYESGVGYEWSYTDESSPFNSGKVGFRPTSSGATYLKSLKIYSAEPSLAAGDTNAVELSVPYMPWSHDESKVITAVYKNDATKELVTTSMKSLSDFASGAVEVAPSSYNKADYQIKTFIWDSLDSMKPLTAPIVLAE